MTEPKNSIIKQYEASFALDNVKLTFTEDAIEAIAQQSFEQNTGARGLRSIVENLMLGISYDIPSEKGVSEVIIDKDNVINKTTPRIIKDGKYIC